MMHGTRPQPAQGAASKAAPKDPPDIVPAGIPRRAFAAMLDAAILTSAYLLLKNAQRSAGLYSGATNETLWFYPAAGLLIVLLYQLFFLCAMQSTPGMAFLRISVAQLDGRTPTARQILIRALATIPSAAALGLGFAWALFNRERRTWHDLAADTIVIRGSPTRAATPKPIHRQRSGDKTYRLG